ncbi:MAG TPA: energy-coupling factor ABC transporter permease [Symbiobacteriaceae bacterium]|nr:energy-coupling factor ABC transporter permease [Symbiobacteriaceae bacterium]
MHIPDGLLNAKVIIGSAAVAAVGIGYAARQVRRDLDARHVPRVAALAAFVFATQMVNFPIAGGTSGHLMGGALAAVAFGPWVGTMVLTTVVTLQALLFQDGGVAALGANLLNMALVGPLTAYGCYRAVRHLWPTRAGWWAAVFLSGLLSVLATALAGALELGLAGVIPLRVGLPAIALWHLFIGLGEGAITAGVVSYLASERPELIRGVGTR